MRYIYPVARWASAAIVGAAAAIGAVAGIGGALAPVPLASVDITNSQPPPPGPKITSATLTSVDVPTTQPPATGPNVVVITGPGPGDPGPK